MPQLPRVLRSSTKVCRSCCACCIRWSRTRRGYCGTTSGTLRVWVTCSTRAGHDELAAQLAVDLQHEFHLFLRQRAFVAGRPARVEHVTHTRSVPEVVPQHP